MKTIGIAGKKRSGKNTAAQYLQSKIPNSKIVSLAEPVKELTYLTSSEFTRHLITSRGWEVAKNNPLIRTALQTIGDGCRKILGEDIWIQALFKKMDEDIVYIISDIRYVNEVEVFEKTGPILRLEREDKDDNHISEIDLDEYSFEVVIDNKGSLEELFGKLDQFYDNLKW